MDDVQTYQVESGERAAELQRMAICLGARRASAVRSEAGWTVTAYFVRR